MYRSIDLKEKATAFEKRIREYWEQNDIQNKSIDFREGAEEFVFFEGPPTANGKPGIHHVIARALKDAVCRYKTMSGYQVKRKAGWDTHGLPVEIEIEKKLGLKNKSDIEEYGIDKFNKECKESVFSYEKEWVEMTKTMGYWVDLEKPYITLENNYIETVWWILKQFYDKGLIYKGHKIVPYCPSCGTPLSSHEVAQGYQDVEDPSVFVKFRAVQDTPLDVASRIPTLCGLENTYFLAWTTTPWTLISNVALVVNPNETYVKVKSQESEVEYLILAKERLSVLDIYYEIVEEFLGKDLEYTKYEQLFDYIKVDETTTKGFYIACGDYVTMTDGTGIVHTAPAFGQDDYNIAMKYKLPFIQPVDDAGCFTEDITDFKGMFVKDADKGIIRNLKERDLLYKRTQIIHNYPFCWRCKSPLIYYARSTWYIKTSDYKNKLIENNNNINWYPSFVGEKRFGEWLENNVDWALSRDRFWGTPLNIWRCDDCKENISIGSISELREKGIMEDGSPVPADIELHRPFVDKISLPCPKCEKQIFRSPEVIDCWFDSGAMPFAQWHYPFENKEIFDNKLFPADFICEGIDQTRGWFYSLLAISTILTGKSPYKNVLVNDLVLDKTGMKMSKSKGNSVDPMELMANYGADGVRWYLIHVSPPWTPTKFDVKDVEEVYSKFIGTLKNVYSFYITYASIDNYTPPFVKGVSGDLNTSNNSQETSNRSSELDQWILSRLNSLIDLVIENNEKYDFTRSLRAMQKFVIDDLSNWYVRRSRRRYWAMELTEDKKEAYLTLYEVLIELSKLIAPFAPFIAEDIFTNLNSHSQKGDISVHLQTYPVPNPALINKTLEKEMQALIDIVTMGRAARNQAQIKVRQTLQALYVHDKHADIVNRMEELIKEEINVKKVILLPERNDLVKWQAKLNLKTAGPKFGKDIKIISSFLETAYIIEVLNSFKEKKHYDYIISGVDSSEDNIFKLLEEDLFISITQKDGFTFENNGVDFVVLETRMTEDLIMEGHARELVNKIQFTRKENNFDIMDKVKVYYSSDAKIKEVFYSFCEYISSETLCDGFEYIDIPNNEMKMWDINGYEVHLKVVRV